MRRRRRPRERTPEEQHAELLRTPIAELALPVRVVNALEEYDMILCEHLLRRTRESLLRLPNIRAKTVRDIATAVRAIGIDPPADWET